ncbi:histone H3.v1-like [Dermacentor albipictus]|uniref:histone H3.v1-like n=1 Tax=Dermacentor albipictus TaxID=60249 RepID=UPI0031FC15A5
MDYGSPKDLPTYYDVPYYGLDPEADQPRANSPPEHPWYAASQRRRSSGQIQMSLISEDELDRYATIRPHTARPGVPPGPNYGGLRRISTNLDRYVNLSESANTVTDFSAVSEQLLQLSQQQLPRYVPNLAQKPQLKTPLSATLAPSKDATAVFAEPAVPPPTPVPVRVPEASVPRLESPVAVAASLEKKSTNSRRRAQQNAFFPSAAGVKSDPKEINNVAVSNALRAKKMFRSDECGDRSWAVLRQDATVHSLPATSTEEVDVAQMQKARPAELSCPAKIRRKDSLPHPPPPILSASESSEPSGSSGTSSMSSTSSEYSEEDSDTSQSISACGDTVSKSTRLSNRENPPTSCAGTPSSVPMTASSTTMTYIAAKSPDATVSCASKHSPAASRKSREHRSPSRTPPSNARTPTELRSKSKTPPPISATKIPASVHSRSRTPASTTKTRSTQRSLSKSPASTAKTTPTSTRPPTLANLTPPPSPKTPHSILRTPQRSSVKTASSRARAVGAEEQEQMSNSRMRESVTETQEVEYALPAQRSQRDNEDRRNPGEDNNGEFHSEQIFNSLGSSKPSVIQHSSQNTEKTKHVSVGGFQSGVNQTSHLPPRRSSSQEDAIVPKFTPHSAAFIRHEAAAVARVPVTSVSVPVAKGVRAAKEHSTDLSSVSRLTRPISAAPMRNSLAYQADKFPPSIRESRRHLQSASSAQTSSKKKLRSTKVIQYPDQTGCMKLAFPGGELDFSNFQSSEASTGRPLIPPSKDKTKTDSSMLMHLCVAINVILFSALSGIVFAYFLHMGTIRKA